MDFSSPATILLQTETMNNGTEKKKAPGKKRIFRLLKTINL